MPLQGSDKLPSAIWKLILSFVLSWRYHRCSRSSVRAVSMQWLLWSEELFMSLPHVRRAAGLVLAEAFDKNINMSVSPTSPLWQLLPWAYWESERSVCKQLLAVQHKRRQLGTQSVAAPPRLISMSSATRGMLPNQPLSAVAAYRFLRLSYCRSPIDHNFDRYCPQSVFQVHAHETAITAVCALDGLVVSTAGGEIKILDVLQGCCIGSFPLAAAFRDGDTIRELKLLVDGSPSRRRHGKDSIHMLLVAHSVSGVVTLFQLVLVEWRGDGRRVTSLDDVDYDRLAGQPHLTESDHTRDASVSETKEDEQGEAHGSKSNSGDEDVEEEVRVMPPVLARLKRCNVAGADLFHCYGEDMLVALDPTDESVPKVLRLVFCHLPSGRTARVYLPNITTRDVWLPGTLLTVYEWPSQRGFLSVCLLISELPVGAREVTCKVSVARIHGSLQYSGVEQTYSLISPDRQRRRGSYFVDYIAMIQHPTAREWSHAALEQSKGSDTEAQATTGFEAISSDGLTTGHRSESKDSDTDAKQNDKAVHISKVRARVAPQDLVPPPRIRFIKHNVRVVDFALDTGSLEYKLTATRHLKRKSARLRKKMKKRERKRTQPMAEKTVSETASGDEPLESALTHEGLWAAMRGASTPQPEPEPEHTLHRALAHGNDSGAVGLETHALQESKLEDQTTESVEEDAGKACTSNEDMSDRDDNSDSGNDTTLDHLVLVDDNTPAAAPVYTGSHTLPLWSQDIAVADVTGDIIGEATDTKKTAEVSTNRSDNCFTRDNTDRGVVNDDDNRGSRRAKKRTGLNTREGGIPYNIVWQHVTPDTVSTVDATPDERISGFTCMSFEVDRVIAARTDGSVVVFSDPEAYTGAVADRVLQRFRNKIDAELRQRAGMTHVDAELPSTESNLPLSLYTEHMTSNDCLSGIKARCARIVTLLSVVCSLLFSPTEIGLMIYNQYRLRDVRQVAYWICAAIFYVPLYVSLWRMDSISQESFNLALLALLCLTFVSPCLWWLKSKVKTDEDIVNLLNLLCLFGCLTCYFYFSIPGFAIYGSFVRAVDNAQAMLGQGQSHPHQPFLNTLFNCVGTADQMANACPASLSNYAVCWSGDVDVEGLRSELLPLPASAMFGGQFTRWVMFSLCLSTADRLLFSGVPGRLVGYPPIPHPQMIPFVLCCIFLWLWPASQFSFPVLAAFVCSTLVIISEIIPRSKTYGMADRVLTCSMATIFVMLVIFFVYISTSMLARAASGMAHWTGFWVPFLVPYESPKEWTCSSLRRIECFPPFPHKQDFATLVRFWVSFALQDVAWLALRSCMSCAEDIADVRLRKMMQILVCFCTWLCVLLAAEFAVSYGNRIVSPTDERSDIVEVLSVLGRGVHYVWDVLCLAVQPSLKI